MMKILRQITLKYPFCRGQAFLGKILPEVTLDGEIKLKNDLKLYSFSSNLDIITKHSYYFGDFDPEISITLKRLLKKGDVAIDIGANIGLTAMVSAIAVEKEGKVICFEPISQNYKSLCDNIKKNVLSQVVVNQIGLSDQERVVSMWQPKEQFGQFRIVDSTNNLYNYAQESQIQCTTLDKYLEENPVQTIKVCKIDVEGHEMNVFQGMRKSLESKSIESFIFEHHINWKICEDPLFNYLRQYKYNIFRVDKSLTNVNYVTLGKKPKFMSNPTPNFVAVIPQSEAERNIISWILK
ncbi:FkbM family methyltransferase [Cyanobacterium aponinum UTEX 3222]|uniref:FkbM family methyltransferase n=1 Tax=Cyanobacterium aponinum TaxID=379064 RepID=UPI000C12AFED|nr:FkbM family methyltransferase [Cyanobacterium aponinum]MBD2395744.1 FkbM family methyltransferase [Cyanobacterium aponinum FACHB-4101]PHV62945.1 hypothetical protein CSQ80_07840 [Cyanobacterium aponinum IPPAS B-1201]WRL37782.1 FkbM family methyltransferase [Cyanobacterium aponinum UTEX 3221]WRL41740.1 FkbM family methyltransferase [Cyanobacterium aponinum UTEX 3222]